MADRQSAYRPVGTHLHGAFGADAFGRRAETFARLFGTATFLDGQTVVVLVCIAPNVAMATLRCDPYPFILLNLAFSLQAAFAAPLILLAQTRQADRDKAVTEADAAHREELASSGLARQDAAIEQTEQTEALLVANTALTENVQRLTREIHDRLIDPTPSDQQHAREEACNVGVVTDIQPRSWFDTAQETERGHNRYEVRQSLMGASVETQVAVGPRRQRLVDRDGRRGSSIRGGHRSAYQPEPRWPRRRSADRTGASTGGRHHHGSSYAKSLRTTP
jgi:uncharacterized membrane protein